MKRNVIMIVVDAFFYDYLGEKKYKKSATKFLDKLSKNPNCTSISKMYAEAPYTEAALMSLLGGCNTMDNGGYMKRLKNTNCVLNEFQKYGYRVFANCYQSSTYPGGALPGINEKFYNASFSFSQCWQYRIKNYKKLYDENSLTNEDYKLLIDILEDNFREAKLFLNALKNNEAAVELIYNKVDLEHVNSDLDIVKHEYKLFKQNKKEYLNNIFDKNGDTDIMNLYIYPIVKKVDDNNVLIEIEKRYKKIVKKVFWKNFILNLINNRISLKKLFLLLKNNKISEAVNYIKKYGAAIIDVDLIDRIRAKTYNHIKTITSATTQFEHFKEWLDIKTTKENYFAYLHIDDIHFREIFFTHDTKNLDLMDQEFEWVKDYIKNLPYNYKGNLTYDLGVQYVDKKIEDLFLFLEKKGELENTDIIITADHGNSYSFNPIRENYVINSYEENYHIPCLFYSTKHKLNIDQNNFYQSKDIPATLLDMNGIEKPLTYSGESLLNFKGRDYVVIEYIGAGCPDMIHRPIKIGIRNKDYSITGEVFLNDIKTLEIKEIYDLKNDKKENINLLLTNKKYNVDKEMKIINKEIQKIINNNKKIFVKELKNENGKNN